MTLFYAATLAFIFLAFVGILLGFLPALPDGFIASITTGAGWIKGIIALFDSAGHPLLSRFLFIISILSVALVVKLILSVWRRVRGDE